MRPEQDPLEGLPELGTEDGIDDRIERRVEVAQPEKQRHYRIVDVTGLAQGQKEGHQKKWQPAHDEGSGDDGKRFGGFAFPLRLQSFLPLGDLGVQVRRAGNVQRRSNVGLRSAEQVG